MGSTPATIAEDGRPGALRPARLVGLALVLIGGVVLAVQAGPRLIADILKLSGAAVVFNLEVGRPVELDIVRTALDARLRSLAWSPDATTRAEAGRLAFVLGSQLDTARSLGPEEPRQRLDQAVAILTESVARRPLSAYAWFQLGMALTLRDGASREGAQAMTRSIAAGPREPGLIVARLPAALVNWSEMTLAERGLVVAQIRIAGAERPMELADTAAQIGAMSFVRQVLADDPRTLALLDMFAVPPETGSRLLK